MSETLIKSVEQNDQVAAGMFIRKKNVRSKNEKKPLQIIKDIHSKVY